MRENAPASGDFTVRTHKDDASLHVELAGDLDMAAAFKLESEVDALLGSRDVEDLVIDLDQVAFVDSAGLGALLSIRERAGELGIDLAIASVSDPVRRILDVTGLRDTLG